MANRLTSVEFSRIHKNLENHSDTWADLWLLLNLTRARVTQLLQCSFRDIQKDVLLLPAYSVFAEKRIPLSPTARVIIAQRRKRYPNDFYLFQSHSPRVRATARPVTVIAFNTALKIVARTITHKTVSSKSALCIPQSAAHHSLIQATSLSRKMFLAL